MWVILALSVVAVAVLIERIHFFHRNAGPIDVFLSGLSNLLKQKKYDEALERCDEVYHPAAKIAHAAILKRDLPKNELREILQEVAQMQVPRFEAHLRVLSTIGSIAPLLGFLGTVTGMIHAFMTIEQAMGSVPVGNLAGSIWEALITTAGGLIVAIPCYVAYNFLASRLQTVLTDMERFSIEILQILSEK